MAELKKVEASLDEKLEHLKKLHEQQPPKKTEPNLIKKFD